MECTDRNRESRAASLGRGRPRSRRGSRGDLLGGSAVLLTILLVARSSHGQANPLPEDVINPILLINGQGHTAPLKALAFTSDGSYLLSGGLDKLVHVWEFRRGRPRLDGTIRPPIRNTSGWVYALAVSPVADRPLIAVAGKSLLDSAGQILVYRLPRPNEPGPVELVFELPDRVKTPGNDPRGHRGVVNGLTFSRNGRHLASCGEDKTIRIWNVEDDKHSPVRVLQGDDTGVRGHSGPVVGVAFLDEDGNRLVSAGGMYDGSVRLWDLSIPDPALFKSRILPEQLRKSQDGREFAINALAAVPKGPYVAIGRENGLLQCYDADLTNGRVLNPREQERRLNLVVESLAMTADGKTLAAIVLKYKPTRDELLRTECKVILKSLPDGQDERVVRTTGDVAGALAFSPDGQFLAMGGGAAQEIAIKDLNAAGNPHAAEMKGPGTTLWDVAFVNVRSKPTVAYVRNRPLGPVPPVWEAFDFPARRFVPVDPAARLDGAITTYEGRTVATPGLDQLRIDRAQAAPVTIALDGEAGRWTSYTFIPAAPTAGHAGPTLAVGGSKGSVYIYSLDGRRTRVFQGHSGPVYGMAVSPDGRWLATASADQTIRLWGLAGCDAGPKLGARLERDPQGNWIVGEVPVRSPAREMGLKKGDRVERVGTLRVEIREGVRIESVGNAFAIEQLDAEIDAIEPGSAAIAVNIVRPGGQAANNTLSTFRRDRPALNLLPGSDREWVVWMPESYYDTSIAGDSRLLGWQVNKIVVDDLGVPIARASEFHPMADYEKQLRNRPVIDEVIRTADPAVVLARPRVVVPVVRKPPEIRLARMVGPVPQPLAGQLTVPAEALTLRIQAEAAEGGRIRSIAVFNGPMPYPLDDLPPPAQEFLSLDKEITLWRRDNPVIVEAIDDQGVKRRVELVVRLEAPPVDLRPRLFIVSSGVETFAGDWPAIRYADSDVGAIDTFLAKPGGVSRFEHIDPPGLAAAGSRNAPATTPSLAGKIAELESRARAEAPGGRPGTGRWGGAIPSSWSSTRTS